MKVLFIGGTGNISIASSRLAVQIGIDLFLLNRGNNTQQVKGANWLEADIEDEAKVRELLSNHTFDAVVNWIAYLPAHVERDIRLFAGKTKQYVLVSSASAYQKPPENYLITEKTPLENKYWQYSRDKIACEEVLWKAIQQKKIPGTIVRPSFTYGDTWIPTAMGEIDYTIIDRMRKGKKIISHGDGQSLWSMTHNTDFAKGLIGLLGNPETIGESYHITSDEVLTWDQIYLAMGDAIGIIPNLIHIPSDFIALFDEFIGDNLLGDKACSMVMDNSKIKKAVPAFKATMPFAVGIKQSIDWFEADESRKKVNPENDAICDLIISTYEKAVAEAKSYNKTRYCHE